MPCQRAHGARLVRKLPCWVPGTGRCPSWGLSSAKPAWLSGGTTPAKAPVGGEGKSARVVGWDAAGVARPCGEGMAL